MSALREAPGVVASGHLGRSEGADVLQWDASAHPKVKAEALDAYLEGWRGFGGKGTLGHREVEVLGSSPLAAPGAPRGALQLVNARVRYEDGRSEVYQVPLEVSADGLLHNAAGSDHRAAFYRGLQDLMVEGRQENGVRGELTPAGEAALKEGVSGHPYETIPADSTNTLAQNGDWVVKLLARMLPGMPNRELVHGNLHLRNGFNDVTRVYGALTSSVEGKPATSALLIKREDIAQDAWAYFQSAAKRYASTPAAERPALLAQLREDAHAIGRLTGRMAKSYRVGGDEASVRSRPMGTADVDELMARTSERVDRLMTVARTSSEVSSELSQRILALEPAMRANIESQRAALKAAVVADPARFTLQSGHFDYHLGQLVKTQDGRWVVMDFEGEPAAVAAEGGQLSVAEKDAGGMVRSFSYNDAEFKTDFAPALQESFIEGHNAELPLDPGLLRWMTGEKALYELAYEAQNRPDRVNIPMKPVEAFAAR